MRYENIIKTGDIVGSDNFRSWEGKPKMTRFWGKFIKKIKGIAECDIEHCLLPRKVKNNLNKAQKNIDSISMELKDMDKRMDRLMATLDGEDKWFREER